VRHWEGEVKRRVYWFQNLLSMGAPGHTPEAWEQCTPAPQCASWGRKCGRTSANAAVIMHWWFITAALAPACGPAKTSAVGL
jgi:hypothetical protein